MFLLLLFFLSFQKTTWIAPIVQETKKSRRFLIFFHWILSRRRSKVRTTFQKHEKLKTVISGHTLNTPQPLNHSLPKKRMNVPTELFGKQDRSHIHLTTSFA
ncbi:MAG: hypothetical protein D3909_05765 [Candidatus Electrothrix sp. ATG1]|nr:hypothetical protein [Candidatus Electrothrix sp. ATG1]